MKIAEKRWSPGGVGGQDRDRIGFLGDFRQIASWRPAFLNSFDGILDFGGIPVKIVKKRWSAACDLKGGQKKGLRDKKNR